MIDPKVIARSPDKGNIRYTYIELKGGYETVLKVILEELKSK